MRYDPQRHVWAPLSVTEVGTLLTGCPVTWWLSGGWAIDHWCGTVSRPHGDIDVSTLRPSLPTLLDRLPDRLRPVAAGCGHRRRVAPAGRSPGQPQTAQHLDPGPDRFVLQVNLEDGDDEVWRYRRDARIDLPWDRAVTLVRSVPTGTPATQLLWKSQDPRPVDDHDLNLAYDMLHPTDRRWLGEAIRVAHPSSPWLTVA